MSDIMKQISKKYVISDQKTKDLAKVAYFLSGSRGAVYALLRNREKPYMMFVINQKGKTCKIMGVEWFTDEKGKLEAWE